MKGKCFMESLILRVVVPSRNPSSPKFCVLKFCLVIMAAIIAAPAFAKMYEVPKSFAVTDNSQAQVERKILPTVDFNSLLAEDRQRGKDPQHPRPLRIAVSAEVAYTLDNSGTWQNVTDGRLWRLRIQSPAALNISLGITRFEMPDGTKLWVYDPGHGSVNGPYTSRDRSHLGSLWTPMVQGDEIVVEVFVPTGAAVPSIEITKVNQGYRNLQKGGLFGGSEGACENDEICPIGNPWRKQIRAIGLYSIEEGTEEFACTGNLMNDTALDFKPYILSANHCGVDATNDASIVFYWNFESPTCGTHGPGSLADNQSGAIYHASYAPSDFVLFELSSPPDPSFDVFYAGWDATGVAPPQSAGIHHPATDVKAVSTSNSTAQSADYNGPLDASGNHWQIDWTSGVTEEGSSGSCIFGTNTSRCFGQLHGGPSACGVPASDLHDYYGKFAVSWNGGGTTATRLKDWLDPGSTGALSMNGDPHITTANGIHYDFQGAGEYVALLDTQSGLEIQTRQEPVATTFNPGPDAHDGLATCVSINTAVAARVGKHRITYEPNLSGVADPSGLQLRLDGTLKTLGPKGEDLAGGGHIGKSSAAGSLQIDFPDATVLYVTPDWWASQHKWYLNVDVVRAPASDGAAPGSVAAAGVMGPIARDSWLPALPDGASIGPMPGAAHDRYVALYQKFATAWRVTDKTTLFDYAKGASTHTFTVAGWPLEKPPCVLPHVKPEPPANEAAAEKACERVKGETAYKDCVFDVLVTGNTGFAATHETSVRLRSEALARLRP